MTLPAINDYPVGSQFADTDEVNGKYMHITPTVWDAESNVTQTKGKDGSSSKTRK